MFVITNALLGALVFCGAQRADVSFAASKSGRRHGFVKPLLSNGPAGATVSGLRSRRARERSAAHGSRDGAGSGLQIAGPGVPYSKQMAPRTTTAGRLMVPSHRCQEKKKEEPLSSASPSSMPSHHCGSTKGSTVSPLVSTVTRLSGCEPEESPRNEHGTSSSPACHIHAQFSVYPFFSICPHTLSFIHAYSETPPLGYDTCPFRRHRRRDCLNTRLLGSGIVNHCE